MKYNFEALYFQIFRNVLEENKQLGSEALPVDQLREVATTIFIASTSRGIFRPSVHNGFIDSIFRLLRNTHQRSVQGEVYKQVKEIISKNGN